MKHALRNIAAFILFAGLAIVAAGCSDSRLAANNAASNAGQVQPSSYQTGYGLTSEGPTTDLYTELKGSFQRPERPHQATAAVQQPASAGTSGQQVADSSPGVVQPQAPAGPPAEEPTATVYGMSSDGPTTDIYTALFGPRNR